VTARDLLDFERECKGRFGWVRQVVAQKLSISHDRYLRMIDGGRIPEHIALACSALLLGIPPYPEPVSDK